MACFTSSGMVAVSSPSILVRFSFDSDSSAAAPFCEEGWARERRAGVGERSRWCESRSCYCHGVLRCHACAVAVGSAGAPAGRGGGERQRLRRCISSRLTSSASSLFIEHGEAELVHTRGRAPTSVAAEPPRPGKFRGPLRAARSREDRRTGSL